jgi:cyclopropane fatty-acyl-phospholipid synthase-like methyltransferase
MKPYSEACERNAGPIMEILARVFADRRQVLEIGTGTGQHAVRFASLLPHLVWQTSDLIDAHPGIQAWLADARLCNVRDPIALDVRDDAWPVGRYDAFFSANVIHIAGWQAVQSLFRGIGRHRADDCVVAFYGPYNYDGQYTSQSNAVFDAWLRRRNPESGIRDFEAVNALAAEVGLTLVEDNAMPANNRLLVWR